MPASTLLSSSGTDRRIPAGRAISSLAVPALLTPVVLLVHGYHPYANDAGLYVAGIRHILDPTLYPLNAAFVTAFTRFSIFPWTLAALVRLVHLPLASILLAAQLASIFLFLAACRQLATRLEFPSPSFPVLSTLVAAACASLPVAGTALVLTDPYLTARSFSTPLGILAVCGALDRAWLRTILLLIAAALFHPLMAAYTASFVLLLVCVAAGRLRLALILCALAIVLCGVAFAAAHAPVSPAYREAVSLAPRSFLFLARWRWYEIAGLLLPLLFFAAGVIRFPASSPARSLSLACLLLGSTATLIATLFVPPAGPYPLVPFQVLRSFHIIYLIGLVLAAGILSSAAAHSRSGIAALFFLLFSGMFLVERFAWPGCDRIERPGASPRNPYEQAFLWIRAYTPPTAVFAFNPQLVYLSEEDEQGFRAIAQRDHLADDKDAGVAAVLPHLAERWAAQRNPEFSVDTMTDAERLDVLLPLGANWLLLPPWAPTAFPCPWRNSVVKICRLAR